MRIKILPLSQAYDAPMPREKRDPFFDPDGMATRLSGGVTTT
jgi:hypothetical protein